MDGKSKNIKEEQLKKLKELFPEVFTEGNEIDWEKLKLALGENINIKDERYVLNWAGKSDAYRVLQEQTTATLKPIPEESVNFDSTENIFIEGENLEVLKVLQKSYFGKIKMIYIDPPYNTGNDNFIYPDKFKENKEDYLKRIDSKDESGYLMKEGFFRKNNRDNGHFHSNWMSMMYPRLYLARNLLRDDGVIFVSIDDNEVHNLKMLMNEVFGEENFIAIFPWKKRTAKSDVPFGVSQVFEWIICYAKSAFFIAGVPHNRKYYKTEDFPVRWRISDLKKQTSAEERPNSFFTMINPKNGKKYHADKNRTWMVSKETFKEYYDKGKIIFPGDYEFLNNSGPVYRVFETEDVQKSEEKYGVPGFKVISTLLPISVGMTEDGTKEIQFIFQNKIFPFPKPSSLIKYLLSATISKNDIILDFFSGSATTGHAVLDLNKENIGNRKFILVQLPEKCDENSEAFKDGYKTIADIGKERIRRVIKKIKEEKKNDKNLFSKDENKMDLGFKVFKLTSSNFKSWRGDDIKNEGELVEQLEVFESSVKPETIALDRVYEIILKAGYDLNTDIEEIVFEKSKYYSCASGEIVIVLDKISKEMIKQIITKRPLKCIMLDLLFDGNDQLKTNTALQMKDAEIEFRTV